jgi:hypothetical protein
MSSFVVTKSRHDPLAPFALFQPTVIDTSSIGIQKIEFCQQVGVVSLHTSTEPFAMTETPGGSASEKSIGPIPDATRMKVKCAAT